MTTFQRMAHAMLLCVCLNSAHTYAPSLNSENIDPKQHTNITEHLTRDSFSVTAELFYNENLLEELKSFIPITDFMVFCNMGYDWSFDEIPEFIVSKLIEEKCIEEEKRESYLKKIPADLRLISLKNQWSFDGQHPSLCLFLSIKRLCSKACILYNKYKMIKGKVPLEIDSQKLRTRNSLLTAALSGESSERTSPQSTESQQSPSNKVTFKPIDEQIEPPVCIQKIEDDATSSEADYGSGDEDMFHFEL